MIINNNRCYHLSLYIIPHAQDSGGWRCSYAEGGHWSILWSPHSSHQHNQTILTINTLVPTDYDNDVVMTVC